MFGGINNYVVELIRTTQIFMNLVLSTRTVLAVAYKLAFRIFLKANLFAYQPIPGNRAETKSLPSGVHLV